MVILFSGAKSYRIGTDYIYPYKVFNVQCDGNETKLLDCKFNIISSLYCSGAVAVLCQKSKCLCNNKSDMFFIQTLLVATIEAPVNCTEGDIRLYGGSKPNEGILHICTNGAWGTVCLNSYWSNNEANVACRELGYTAYGILCYYL